MAKKRRSAKQKANDKRLGRMAKARARGRITIKNRVSKAQVKRTVRRVTRKRNTRKAFNKAKKTSRRMPRRSGLKGITSSSTLKKVALGVGGATMAAALLSFVAPNSSIGKFAPAAGAYALGGLEGVIGNFALGMIGNRSASASNANVAPQMEVL
tara:strand:+ start:728 stop:1192 length:465 start_codon:yes stop_codon:yes gene_type:complete